MVTLPSGAPAPRICLVKKDWPEQEYGYNLHAERGKGQFIGNVDPGSPADKAGLVAGDRIYAVNGALIANETHKQVVGRIKENPLQCELLVIDEEGERWYRENKIEITPDLPNIIRHGQQPRADQSAHAQPSAMNGNSNGYQGMSSSPSPVDSSSTSPPPPQWYSPPGPTVTTRIVTPTVTMTGNPDGRPLPRLSHLIKKNTNDEFGFNLHAERGRGHFIGKVDAGGIGDKAGLIMGQRIVGVNGELIFPSTPHKDVVYLIKKDPMHTTLLVASEDVDQWYKERGAQYSFDLAEAFGDHPTTLSYQPPAPSVIYVPPTIVEPDNVSESSTSADESRAGDESDYEEPHRHELSHPAPAATEISIPPPDYDSSPMHMSNGHHAPTQELKYEEHKPEPMHVQMPPPETAHSPAPPMYATFNKPVNTMTPSPTPRSAPPAKPQISPSGNPQLDSAFGMSAAEMRAQLARRKKADPRKDSSLSIQEKHRVVTNM